MKNKIYLFIILGFFLIGFASARGLIVPEGSIPINYTLVNTNHSLTSDYATTSGYSSNSGQLEGRDTATLKTYLQGLYDAVYCKLTGCTMTGNLITSGNITATNFNGKFNWTSGDNWNIFDGSTLTFNETKIATQYFNASTIEVVTGTPQGDLIDIQLYDGIFYNVSEVASDFELIVNFTGIAEFTTLIVRHKIETSDGHQTTIQIWDYDNSRWEGYGFLSEDTTSTIQTIGIYDDADHIQDGVVQVRFYQDETPTPPETHKHQFDWVALSKGLGTPAGQETDPLSWHKNSTGEDGNFLTDGNVSADYGFFNYLGNTLNKVKELFIETINFNSTINDVYWNTSLENDVATWNVYLGEVDGTESEASIYEFDGDVNVTENITASYFKGDGSELTGIESGIWVNDSGVATYDGNVSADYGFFNYLGNTLNKVKELFIETINFNSTINDVYWNTSLENDVATWNVYLGEVDGTESEASIYEFDGDVNVTENITASYFKGDGSELTGIESGIWVNDSGVATYDGNVSANTFQGDSLQINGSVLFDGNIGSTPIPSTGSRFMWIPDKSAIRAGYSYGDYWEDSQIGVGSVGLGYYVKANGSQSVALGSEAFALGDTAVAIGYYPIAEGDYSTAIGPNAKAFGSRSVSIGDNTIARGIRSSAMGYFSEAIGNYSIAMGLETICSQNFAFCFDGGNFGIGTGNPSHELNVIGSGNFTENITASYFKGDGSELTGISGGNLSWNESMAYGLFLNKTSETSYLSTYNDTYDTHVADNTQAHSDYLINNGDDTTTGTITAGGFTTTGDATAENLIITSVTNQDYIIGEGHNPTALAIMAQGDDLPSRVDLYAKKGDGGDNVIHRIWAKGTVADITNSEFIEWRYTNARKYELRSASIGTGTVLPIHIYTGTNVNQLILETDGGIKMLNVYSDTVDEINRDLYIDYTGKIGYVSSSIKTKEDVKPSENTNWIYDLNVVDFKYKDKPNGINHTGMIAEEVELIDKRLVSYKRNITYKIIKEETGDRKVIDKIEITDIPETVNYGSPILISSLIKEMQKQKQEIDLLKSQQQDLCIFKLFSWCMI